MGDYRLHAKSSGITLGYGLATLLFRERKFMLLVSDTESQAALFLGNFKEQLQNNRELIDLFDLKTDKDGKVLFIKDTETDIIVEFSDGHKFRVIVKGAEQKLRGLLWNGSRPDIILCDDMENDELVMNKERREKMWRWFTAALLPCISDRGIVRIVGTVLHMDSLLERVMPKYKSSATKHSELKTWMTRPVGMWMSVKYRAHNADFSELLWPQKKDKQHFMNLMADAQEQGTLDIYSQEYLNMPLDPTTAFFKRPDFIEMEPGDYNVPMNKYITVDLAVAQHEKADYSVFLVAGVDENRRVHVLDVIRLRLDAQEIVQMLVNLQRTHNPVMIGIEDMQVTKSIGPFLNEEMVRTQCFMNIVKLKHGGKDKIARAASIQARLRAKNVRFNKQGDWYINFEEECTRFPRDKHDDQVDALSYLGLMLESLIEAPTKQEIDEDEYNERISSSHGGDSGRSSWCGY
jgi:predicted phage terminase large subunit-like protein